MYLPILTYHRLLVQPPTREADPQRISVSQDQFRRQLSWLKRLGYRTVRLEDYVKWLKNPLTPTLSQEGRGRTPPSPFSGEGPEGGMRGHPFALTFDDGYEDLLTLGLPVLQELGMTATVFAVPGQLGGTNAWDDGSSRLLSAEGLRQLDKAGITIGAHTCQHVHLPKVDPATARREIGESKTRLEEVLGHSVSLFAYPYGETSDAVDRLAEEAGFDAAFATDRASPDHRENRYRLRRAVVFPKNSVLDIVIKAQRWYPSYQDWKRR